MTRLAHSSLAVGPRLPIKTDPTELRALLKRLLVVAAATIAVAGLTATAQAETLTRGKLVAFAYNSDTKVGKLTIHRSSGNLRFRVDRKTDCGVSYGNPPQSGDSIRCATLGRAKYDNRPVRVTWHRGPGGGRVADVVAVALP
jgi:hypothetical protein